MARVVLDIETLSFPLDTFDETQKDYLFRFAKTEEEKTDALLKLNLYPTTAQIIAIGMYNPDTERGKILFQSDGRVDTFSESEMVHYLSGTEKEIVAQFWEDITKYEQIITFNGRGFDCPFLHMRSAILEIQPKRNLLPYRYDASIHCDLLEQFTFYGAVRKFNLDFYCKAFGIESPKSHGITGLDLGTLWNEKRFREIAEYCLGDLKATAELFRRWDKYLKI
ncbi:MAG: ribonuclease H-like domain-containing protein [Ignavibacteriae bacterium]|nr:ribonuclease H-like domain-containing protein [Ignavibacteriota bacterium]